MGLSMDGPTGCDRMEDGGFADLLDSVGYGFLLSGGIRNCDCTGCNCKELPKPKILTNVWNSEATEASVRR